MGDILYFAEECKSCGQCGNMVRLDKMTTMCSAIDFVNADGSAETIYPIKGGKRSRDWNACEGEDFVRRLNRKKVAGGKN